MPGFIGVPELLLLGLLALILFGPKRLPEMGRGLGKGMREFKESISGDHHEAHSLEAARVETVAVETVPVEAVSVESVRVETMPFTSVRDEERVA